MRVLRVLIIVFNILNKRIFVFKKILLICMKTDYSIILHVFILPFHKRKFSCLNLSAKDKFSTNLLLIQIFLSNVSIKHRTFYLRDPKRA